MQNFYKKLSGALPLVVSLYACSSQADPSYEGEPLAVVHGQIINSASNKSTEAEAALLYIGGAVSVERSSEQFEPVEVLTLAETVSVSGVFPAGFRMNVYSPPPAAGFSSTRNLQEIRGDQLGPVPSIDATALIVALKPGTDKHNVKSDDIIGVSLDHAVVYFERGGESHHDGAPVDFSLMAASGTALDYSVPLTKGYHLAKMRTWTTEDRKRFWTKLNNGLCIRYVTEPEDMFQKNRDMYYNLCLDYSDVPTQTCVNYAVQAPTPEQIAETERCGALKSEFHKGTSLGGPGEPPASSFIQNPDEFSSPVTITFGATVDDFFYNLR